MNAVFDFRAIFSHNPSESFHQDNFTSELFRLIAKAKGENINHLRRAFPRHVEIYEEWMACPDPAKFDFSPYEDLE